MGWQRVTFAIAAAALTVALLVWLGMSTGQGDSGTFHLSVLGPGGIAIFEGEVEDEDATALSVLLVAAAEAGFEVETQEFQGFGSCGTFVESIAGYGSEGGAGWNYYLWDGDWQWVPYGACQAHLEDGDRVLWQWRGSDGSW